MRDLLTLGKRSLEEFLDDNCTLMAAAISYYVLFSLFPLLIFVIGLMGLFLSDEGLQQDVIDAVLDFVPLSEDEGRDTVTDAVEGVSGVGGGALGLLGLLGMAWSASAMFGVIRRSLNTAYDLDVPRPLVQQKLVDLAMVLALGLFFLLSIGATAFLRIAQRRSEEIPGIGPLAEDAGFLWTIPEIAIPLAFSFVAFLVLYTLVPATDVRSRDAWPGAAVAAVLFEITKMGFSIYLENFSNYDLVYGSLGAVIAFLFWVYLGANILLFGAEVASEYPRVRRGDYAEVEPGPAKPLRERLKGTLRGLVFRNEKRQDGGDRRSRPSSGARPPE